MTVGLLSFAAPQFATPFGRVVLNINEPAYYNNYLPWLDIWRNSESTIDYQNAGGTPIFRSSGPPGGNSFGIPSAIGVCCDSNGEAIDFSVTAPLVTNFIKPIYLGGGSIGITGQSMPDGLRSTSYTVTWTGGIGWQLIFNNIPGSGTFTTVASTSSFAFTFPATCTNGQFMKIQFLINTGSRSDPPKNIRCIPTSAVGTFNPAVPNTMINPAYISFLQNTAGILRSMPIMSTVGNVVSTSIDTITPTAAYDWSIGVAGVSRGCPLDLLTSIAKQSNKHLWFNIPPCFVGPKITTFGNSNTNPYDPSLGSMSAANPCIFNAVRNQPFVNGDAVLPWQANTNAGGGFWGRSVKCQNLVSSVFQLSGHNFANGQLVRVGCDSFNNGDTSTYPTGTGFGKGTYLYICNVVAGVSFQVATIAAPSTPITLTGTMKGPVNLFGAITGGSGYTNGTYTNVPMTGGTGTSCTATVIVAGGVVTSVIPNYSIIANHLQTGSGSGFTIGDSLSALAANIGGTGTGFSVLVSCIDINVNQNVGAAGNTFTVAGATTTSFQLSGPGSDTSFYGVAVSSPAINIGTGFITGNVNNGETIIFGALDGVFQDQSTYPTGITKGQIYFAVNSTGSTFQFSATRGGSPITLSGSMIGPVVLYRQVFATSASAMSLLNLSWLQTQIDRAATVFKTAFSGTQIRTLYEYGNEVWNGSYEAQQICQAQSLTLNGAAIQNNIAAGYIQAAIADQLYTSYGGDKSKYRMLLAGHQGSNLVTMLTGINQYLTQVGSSRTIAQLFDYIIYAPYLGAQSRIANSGNVAATFTNGTPGTVTLGSGTGSQNIRPYKFHATSGTLPTGLLENTTYWISGSVNPWQILPSPTGSPITLSGGGGTYVAYRAQTDVMGELMYQSILLGPGPAGNGTNPTKYNFYSQSMREDAFNGKWTGLEGPGTAIVTSAPSAFSIQYTATAVLPDINSQYLAVGKPYNGMMGILPYEGGDDNTMSSNFFAANQASGTFTGTISNGAAGAGTLLNVTSGTTLQIGMDITTGATAGTLIVGIRNDLGPGNYTVNISQNTTPTGWSSATASDFFVNNMYSTEYAQAFVDAYNTLGTSLSGYYVQFLDCNPVAYAPFIGTYGMVPYIGATNPRLTAVQTVNNLP